jgi:Asp-tRNA(Asn)/Glu-tRNA(Gln) amidotransferase A subunit family amidase
MPLATAGDAPIGLSLIGAYGDDSLLLHAASQIGEQFAVSRDS